MYHLAQFNIARALAPLNEPTMAGFVARLGEINARADAAEGFIWRLQTDAGDATAIRIFEDPLIIVNLSVWESIEDLKHFTYRSMHAELLRDRKAWFSRLERPHQVMWWIPAGHVPSLEEAKQKLERLESYGATSVAFNFSKTFAPPENHRIDTPY